jgi:hypothetical protein
VPVNVLVLLTHIAGDRKVLVHPEPDHPPATSTVLDLPVDGIGKAVDELVERGVRVQRQDGFGMDETGIARGEGPSIAWFTVLAVNVLPVLQE